VRPFPIRSCGLVLLAVLLLPSVAWAQATLRGRVLDSETGSAVVGATVNIGRGAAYTTDSLGIFEVTGLTRGDKKLAIIAIGYAVGDYVVPVGDTGTVIKIFPLDFTGQRMAAVAVQARAEQLSARYSEFERRRARGLGAFFRWDDLSKESYGSIGDAIRTVRGVRMQCRQDTFECQAVMVRAPRGCAPVWIIDGQEVRSFHENTPIRDVYGIEIFRGPGEVPGEYAGSNAACGVIVVWTKSRPYRLAPQ
jgi:hypothetical protein